MNQFSSLSHSRVKLGELHRSALSNRCFFFQSRQHSTKLLSFSCRYNLSVNKFALLKARKVFRRTKRRNFLRWFCFVFSRHVENEIKRNEGENWRRPTIELISRRKKTFRRREKQKNSSFLCLKKEKKLRVNSLAENEARHARDVFLFLSDKSKRNATERFLFFSNVEKKMLNRSRPADDDRILARCYAELAILTKERGDFDESLSYHRKSMEIFQRIDEPLDVADRHLDIAQIYKVKGEFRRAMTEYEKGLTLYEDTLIESTDSGLEFSQNSSSFFGTENAKFLSKSQQISSSSSIFDEESNDEQFTEFSFGQIFDAEKVRRSENFLFFFSSICFF